VNWDSDPETGFGLMIVFCIIAIFWFCIGLLIGALVW